MKLSRRRDRCQAHRRRSSHPRTQPSNHLSQPSKPLKTGDCGIETTPGVLGRGRDGMLRRGEMALIGGATGGLVVCPAPDTFPARCLDAFTAAMEVLPIVLNELAIGKALSLSRQEDDVRPSAECSPAMAPPTTLAASQSQPIRRAFHESISQQSRALHIVKTNSGAPLRRKQDAITHCECT